MYVDFRKNKNKSIYSTNICIIGSGAAGISIAKYLLDKKIKVLVIESGDFKLDDRTQNLYDGLVDGFLPRAYTIFSRLRYFGGTTNHWSGYCRLLDKLDLEKQSWLGLETQWPFSFNKLLPFYKQACEYCGISDIRDDEANLKRLRDHYTDLLTFDLDSFETRIFYQSRVSFGVKYRRLFKKDGNVCVLKNANLTDLKLAMNGKHIANAVVKSLTGKQEVIHADYFILACGGIENARVLLNSSIAKIVDRNGMLGKGFMEHPWGRCGKVVISSNKLGKVNKFWDTKGIKSRAFKENIKLVLVPTFKARKNFK